MYVCIHEELRGRREGKTSRAMNVYTNTHITQRALKDFLGATQSAAPRNNKSALLPQNWMEIVSGLRNSCLPPRPSISDRGLLCNRFFFLGESGNRFVGWGKNQGLQI